MDKVENHLKDLGIGYIRIDGSVSMVARTPLVESFQNDDNVNVI